MAITRTKMGNFGHSYGHGNVHLGINENPDHGSSLAISCEQLFLLRPIDFRVVQGSKNVRPKPIDYCEPLNYFRA